MASCSNENTEANEIESSNSDCTKMCGFCHNAGSKYVCPRCGIPYCSVNCYRSVRHVNCSEQFYRECVEADLMDSDVDPRQMKEILERFKNDEQFEELDSDDSEDTDLADRLKNVDLDDADALWEILTDSERAEFQHIVNSNDVSDLLPLWDPWWSYHEKKKFVQELDQEDVDVSKNCPKVVDNIPKFNSICRVNPAECVKWNLINVLSAYSYCARYYNNEHLNFSLESTSMMFQISKNLNCNQVFQSFDEAVDSVIFELVHHQLNASEENVAALKSDIPQIIAGPSLRIKNLYVLAALSDTRHLLQKALIELKPKSEASKEKSERQFSKMFKSDDRKLMENLDKKRISAGLKRIDFYLSWSKEFFTEAFPNELE